MEYRYPSFHRNLLFEDMAFRGGPAPGEVFPDFNLVSTEGGRLSERDYVGKKPFLLTVGSVTCPMTASSTAALKRLYSQFGNQIEFITLYVREAHPGDRFPQPSTLDQKVKHARAYRERDQIPWPVAVDELDGQFHQRLDGKPNPLYLVDADGKVVFRSLWSDNERAIRKAMMALLSKKPIRPYESKARLTPMLRGVGMMDPTLRSSGPKARRDVLRQAPPLYLMARTAGLFRPLPPLGRAITAMAVVGLSIASTYFAARAINRRQSALK